MKYIIALSLILVLSGCPGLGQIENPTNLSAQQLKQFNEIQLYDSSDGIEYVSLGRIKGISCRDAATIGEPGEEAALNQLKIKAAKLNANAIFYPTCSYRNTPDLLNNCYDPWTCVGEAAQVK